MLNKEKIKNNFKKSQKSYDDFAIVQKSMADKLCSLIPQRKYENILEIGSYTGLLTKKIIKNFEFSSYLALDIIDSFENIKNLDEKIEFQNVDVENFKTNKKFDLIVASASLQWCEDFLSTINKLKSYLNKDGILAISTFDSENLSEIKNVFKVSLNYFDDFYELFLGAKIIKEKKILKFNSSLEILKHLKKTGVNSISNKNFTYREIKEKLKQLENQYQNQLTYSNVYIIYQT